MSTDALWSRAEIRLQAEQVRGQLDVWDLLENPIGCVVCGASAYESCQVECASRQVLA